MAVALLHAAVAGPQLPVFGGGEEPVRGNTTSTRVSDEMLTVRVVVSHPVAVAVTLAVPPAFPVNE